MTLTSFLRALEFGTFVLTTSAVLVYSSSAYRRTQLRAFVFWIASSIIGLIHMSAWYLHISRPFSSQADEMTFNVIYRLGYVVVSILWAIGCLMLIQHVLKTPSNKTLQATATAPGSSTSL